MLHMPWLFQPFAQPLTDWSCGELATGLVASATQNLALQAFRLSTSAVEFSAFSSTVNGWDLRRVDLRDASTANPSTPTTLRLSAITLSPSLFLSDVWWILRNRSAPTATFSAFCASLNGFSNWRFASRAATAIFLFGNFSILTLISIHMLKKPFRWNLMVYQSGEYVQMLCIVYSIVKAKCCSILYNMSS